MPLQKARTEKAFEANVAELRRSYKEKGKIGTTKPRSKEHARRIALAIAFDIKRGGKKRGNPHKKKRGGKC